MILFFHINIRICFSVLLKNNAKEGSEIITETEKISRFPLVPGLKLSVSWYSIYLQISRILTISF